MKSRKCDLCSKVIPDNKGVSFGKHDLCDSYIEIVRRAICKKCGGTGKVREVDHAETNAQATCGENRTQYRTVACKKCK